MPVKVEELLGKREKCHKEEQPDGKRSYSVRTRNQWKNGKLTVDLEQT